MTAFALNPTHGSEPHPLAGTLPVSRAILYATLVVGAPMQPMASSSAACKARTRSRSCSTSRAVCWAHGPSRAALQARDLASSCISPSRW